MTTMYLEEAPSILSWGAETGDAERVHRRYRELVAGAFTELCGEVARVDADLAEELSAAVARAGDRGAEALISPEATYRLLWPRRHDPVESAGLLLTLVGADRLPWERSPVSGIPVDFESPYALSVDLEGTNARRAEPETPLSTEEQRQVRGKIAIAIAGVAATGEEVDWFTRRFTKALVVLPDPASPDKFSSGSTGQFVGRSALGNAQLEKVTPAKTAEALVHEAIHGYLYMGEQRQPWLLDVDLYATEERIASPWTGAGLNLRPFLQACFVWYGLLRFWGKAAARGAFPLEEARERMVQAAIGFLKSPLLDNVSGVADRLAPELLAAIETMQGDVITMFDGEGEGEASEALPTAG
jgi:HEXXH motif-containing protein